jgi:hypothetical protein
MQWLDQAQGAQLMGFMPTMHHSRRTESRQWMVELHKVAAARGVQVFAPVGNLASLAAYKLDNHPYAPVAQAIEHRLGEARSVAASA